LFWGNTDEIYKLFDKDKVKAIKKFPFEDSVALIAQSTIIKSFFKEALAQSLCHEKPLCEGGKTKPITLSPPIKM
jgi:hypothetical protein